MMDAWKDVINGRCFWRFGASSACSILDTYCFFFFKGAGGCGVLGNFKSGSDVAVGCYPAPRMRERG